MIKQKRVIQIIFRINEETCPRLTIISRISSLDICQKKPCCKSSYSSKQLKDWHPLQHSVFSSYFEIINHVHETCFSKHTYRGRKLEDSYLQKNGRKNLATTIFFEQRIKEKLKGTVMQIENALINNRLRVSKVSWKSRIPTIYNSGVI